MDSYAMTRSVERTFRLATAAMAVDQATLMQTAELCRTGRQKCALAAPLSQLVRMIHQDWRPEDFQTASVREPFAWQTLSWNAHAPHGHRMRGSQKTYLVRSLPGKSAVARAP